MWLAAFSIISSVFEPAILNTSASYFGIAVAHSAFNILCTALLLPLSSLLEKIAYMIVPEAKETEKVVELDDRLLATPTIAIEQAEKLAVKMAKTATEGFKLSLQAVDGYSTDLAEQIRAIEGDTDHFEDILGTYLTKVSRHQVTDDDSSKVSKLLKVIGDFERISDHSVNVLESVEELKEKGIEFSAKAKEELGVLCSAVSEILDTTLAAFEQNDLEIAINVEPLEQVIDNLKTLLRDRHVVRLKDGDCTVEAGFIWSDLLTNLERTSDHCSNIAVCVIDAERHDMNAHESLKSIKESSEEFDDKFTAYSKKYSVTC